MLTRGKTALLNRLFSIPAEEEIVYREENVRSFSPSDSEASNIEVEFSRFGRTVFESTLIGIHEDRSFQEEDISVSFSRHFSEEEEEPNMTEHKLHPEEIKSLIPEFNDTQMSVEVWLKKIEALKSSLKWSSELTLLYATSRLSGIPRMWFSEEVVVSYEDFVKKIKEEFKRDINLAQVHNQLRMMTRDKNESHIYFAYRVRMYGKQFDIEDSDIISYIVNGLARDDIYQAISLTKFADFKSLIEVLKNYETNLNLRSTSTSSSSKFTNKGHSQKNQPEDHPRGQSSPSPRCYNCGEVGHKSPNCPKPLKTCEKCRKVGHTKDNCKSRGETNVVSHQYGWSEAEQAQSHQHKPNIEVEVDRDGLLEVQIILGSTVSKVKALLDTGSSINCISHSLVIKSNVDIDQSSSISVFGVNYSKLDVKGKVSATVLLNDKCFSVSFWVVADKTSNHKVILGRDFLNSNNISRLNLDFQNTTDNHSFDTMLMREVVSIEEELYLGNQEITLEVGDTNETMKFEKEITQLFIDNYLDREKPAEPLVRMEVEIKLKDEKPFHARPRRLSNFERNEVRIMVQDMLDSNIIRESESEYTSNIVLTRKKNGKMRMCVNYKPLNRQVYRDHFPMPIIEDLIPNLHGMIFFSSLDLRDGFYHVWIKEEYRKFTSFVTEDGQFEFIRLPFGYANSPAAFVRYLIKVLMILILRRVLVAFIDDILVCTRTLAEHLEVLKLLFQILSDNHIQLQLTKCRFLITKAEFLGYEISDGRVTLSEKHIEAVQSFPVPIDLRSVQRFIGLTSYFRKFVMDFNKIAAPLYACMKAKLDFNFNSECLEAFEILKTKLVTRPVLCIYSPDADTQLHTDASSLGFGGILMQRQAYDNDYHPVMFFSRKTTEAESKLHSFELETLAVVYSLQRFKVYLFGIHFQLITDCKAMQLTLNKTDLNPKITRWALYLEQYDFEIIHRAGEKMQHVDALSRVNVMMMMIDEAESVYDNYLYVNQLSDQKIIKIKEKIANHQLADYEIRDGIVYRSEKGKLLFYVPESMIDSVLFRFHDSLGHFGIDKVCEMIRRSFYFPNMRQEVADHIKKCVTCVVYNPPLRKYDGFLHLPDKGKVPWHTVHIDHLGPLETTKGKNAHIFAVIDAFTKFIKLYPTKTTNANEVLKALKRYKYDYSTPKRLISDRGSAFTSKAFKSFTDDYGIEHIMNATANPQANGQIERYNRTLVPLLAKLKEETRMEWDNVLSDAEFLLNNTWNRSISNIPSILLFGILQKRDLPKGLMKYCEELNEKVDRDLEKIRDEAGTKTKKLQDYNKEQYDKHCRVNTKYKVNDLVALRNTKTVGENSKLMKKFKGPYVVRKVLDNDRYVVSDLDGYQVTGKRFEGVFDPKNMRLYRKFDENQEEESENCSEDLDESECWDVEFLDSDNE